MTLASIRPFYADWPVYHRHIVDLVRGMSDAQLGIRPGPERWPIWATVGHMAGVRVFWLCYVIGEPGIEATPSADPAQAGWEDDLDHPRGPDELTDALTRTSAIVDRCLDHWIPDMLGETIGVESNGGARLHTRQCILLRLLRSTPTTRASSPSPSVSRVFPQIDLWPPEDHAFG